MSAEEETDEHVSLEYVEKNFVELVEQMSSVSKKINLLGKRMREEPLTDDLERMYTSLPVANRPSWFEFVAEQATTEKFASKKSNTITTTHNGHTQ